MALRRCVVVVSLLSRVAFADLDANREPKQQHWYDPLLNVPATTWCVTLGIAGAGGMALFVAKRWSQKKADQHVSIQTEPDKGDLNLEAAGVLSRVVDRLVDKMQLVETLHQHKTVFDRTTAPPMGTNGGLVRAAQQGRIDAIQSEIAGYKAFGSRGQENLKAHLASVVGEHQQTVLEMLFENHQPNPSKRYLGELKRVVKNLLELGSPVTPEVIGLAENAAERGDFALLYALHDGVVAEM